MRATFLFAALGFLGVLNAPLVAQDSSRCQLVVEWNQILLSVAEEEDGFLTLKGVRGAAMMHTAMHDALNAIEPRYLRYTQTRAGEVAGGPGRAGATEEVWEGADPIVAATEAAFEIAVDQYPDRRTDFDALRTRCLADRAQGESFRQGADLGVRVARDVLKLRTDDHWDGEAEYAWHPMGPGVYAEFNEHSGTPEGFVFGAGWAEVRPFLLTSPDHFRSPPPPEIGSDAYTRAYIEVKEVGAAGSTTRTPDQAHFAMWWKEFVESSHNRLARELAVASDLDLFDAARMFALLNLSVFDAYVCVFDNKFTYNHWRPYTAIRWAAHDGNPETEPDGAWTNLHDHTYAFPSYPSAHGCASAAAMTVLADTFGDDTAFTMTIPRVDEAGPFSGKVDMDPPDRSFTAFSEAARECALSRIYLGIHFRYDSEAGYELGAQIGRYAVEGFLVPI